MAESDISSLSAQLAATRAALSSLSSEDKASVDAFRALSNVIQELSSQVNAQRLLLERQKGNEYSSEAGVFVSKEKWNALKDFFSVQKDLLSGKRRLPTADEKDDLFAPQNDLGREFSEKKQRFSDSGSDNVLSRQDHAQFDEIHRMLRLQPISEDQWYNVEQVKTLTGQQVPAGGERLSEVIQGKKSNEPLSFAYLKIPDKNDDSQNHFVSIHVAADGKEITYVDSLGHEMSPEDEGRLKKQFPDAKIMYRDKNGEKLSQQDAKAAPGRLLRVQSDGNSCGMYAAEFTKLFANAGGDESKIKAGIETIKRIDPASKRQEHGSSLARNASAKIDRSASIRGRVDTPSMDNANRNSRSIGDRGHVAAGGDATVVSAPTKERSALGKAASAISNVFRLFSLLKKAFKKLRGGKDGGQSNDEAYTPLLRRDEKQAFLDMRPPESRKANNNLAAERTLLASLVEVAVQYANLLNKVINDEYNRRNPVAEPTRNVSGDRLQDIKELQAKQLQIGLKAKLDAVRDLYRGDPVKSAHATESVLQDGAKEANGLGVKINFSWKTPQQQWEHNALIGKSPPDGFKPSPSQLQGMLAKYGNTEAGHLIERQAVKQGIISRPNEKKNTDLNRGPAQDNQPSKELGESAPQTARPNGFAEGTQCVILGVRNNGDGTTSVSYDKYGRNRPSAAVTITMPTEEANKFSKDRLVYQVNGGISADNPNRRQKQQTQDQDGPARRSSRG